MSSPIDSVLATVRGLLTAAPLVLEGQSLTIIRLPECPPLGMIHEAHLYPIIALEPNGSARSDAYKAGKAYATALTLNLHFVAHKNNLAAHPTIRSPYEYVRKGAEAVDGVLRAAGPDWGAGTGIIIAEWDNAAFETGDEEQGLYAWRTTWQVEYGG